MAVPIGSLKEFPGNPRRGDIPAIAASLEEFGQQGPVIVQKSSGYIVAGNHMWLAAKQLGWKEIAAAVIDVDDETAKSYLLADNRLSDLAVYDTRALYALLRQLADEDALAGTGFTANEMAALMVTLPVPREPKGPADELPAALHTVVISLPESEANQLLRWCSVLRDRYRVQSAAAVIMQAVERQAAL